MQKFGLIILLLVKHIQKKKEKKIHNCSVNFHI